MGKDLTDYEKVMLHIRERCEDIMGCWDGDNPGAGEDAARDADELVELLDRVDELVKELDI